VDDVSVVKVDLLPKLKIKLFELNQISFALKAIKKPVVENGLRLK